MRGIILTLFEIESLMFLYDIEVADWWGWVILLALVVPLVVGVGIAGGSFLLVLFVIAFGNPGSTSRSQSKAADTDPFAEGTDLHSEYFDT